MERRLFWVNPRSTSRLARTEVATAPHLGNLARGHSHEVDGDSPSAPRLRPMRRQSRSSPGCLA